MKSSSGKTYDYFEAMARLRGNIDGLSADEVRFLKAKVALNASDPAAVALYVDLSGDDWGHIYPPYVRQTPVSTGKAIDTFLQTYGKVSPEEDALLEKLIFNPVPDYSSVLEKQEKQVAREADAPAAVNEPTPGADSPAVLARMAGQINGAFQPQNGGVKSEAAAPIAPAVPEPAANAPSAAGSRENIPQPEPLSLELAKIFVKQGHFERAHDIISKIILNNPEKSVYFADQLRFLRKLMRIQKSRRDDTKQ